MDLNDAERYAVAALFTLALHSTHVETGVDKNGNSLSESDIAWGCPSEELFDEYLLSPEPLKLPQELQQLFWGFDCMAHAGLAPRLYAWLQIPRRAWPGLLRMPDLAGNAGSAASVAAFVALVRRYSTFLDPELAFTTGQASRLQQHFNLPAATAAGEFAEQQEQQLQQRAQGKDAAGSPAEVSSAGGADTSATVDSTSKASSTLGGTIAALRNTQYRSSDGDSSKSEADGSAAAAPAGQPCQSALASSVHASEAVAAAAASFSAAAMAAASEEEIAAAAAAAAGCSHSAADHPLADADAEGANRSEQQQVQGSAQATREAAGSAVSAPSAPLARHGSTAAAFNELRATMDQLPKAAAEGTVVPAATFTPAEQYEHSTSHKAVLAVYEIIGGCLSSNTESVMEPFLSSAAREAETAAAAATAAAAKWRQHASAGGSDNSSSSSTAQQAVQAEAATAGGSSSSSLTSRPSAAWFPTDDGAEDEDQTEADRVSNSSATAAATATSKQAKAKEQQQQQLSLQQQQVQQGLAALQWYDARARVAVKRVAHWLRVPWPQVRAFEQMWAAQALSVDPSTQPKYNTGSKAIQYLKVGAAAVGGGALLAVTGGLAAPAIAAGLGAAVTLAHGGAAAAAAVAGFAGSTAGTAAVTGLFGAWGASTAGGSAGRLFGDVSEFGFWDLSGSIFTDGRPLPAKEAAADASAEAVAAVATAAGQEHDAAGKVSPAADMQAGVGSSTAPAAAAGGTSSSGAAAQQGKSSEQQEPRGLLQRLFSTTPAAAGSGSSSSRQQQQLQSSVDGGKAAAGHSSSNARSGSPSQQQQPRRSPIGIGLGWGRSTKTEQEDAEELEQAALRTQYISLQEDAFDDSTSDEDDQQQQQQQQRLAQVGSEAGAAAAAATSSQGSSSSAIPPAASSSTGAARWFTRTAVPPPVYVPLLQTPINPKHQAETRIALTIAVNGCCISSMEDYVRPWQHLPSRDCDRFALVWESACLKELGGALVSFIAQQALTQVTQRTIQAFLYTGLVGALALPMTLTTAMKVAFGSKWLVALRRAQAAGKMLAMQLAQGCHGGRPVTLIGCSMGARLIFHTLLELSRLGAHGCVENVILLGAPLSCRPDRWCIARSVVAGRLINGYSVNDWTLGLLYRVHSSSSIWLQAAGIWKVDVPGIENVNLSRLVNGHADYLTAMDDILEAINLYDG